MGNPSILVMLSGGLDSTAALWKLVNETNENILVHHMNLVNPENRFKIEQIASLRISKYMCRIRDIKYSESTHQYGCYNNNMMYDNDIATFMAGTICLSNPSIKNIAMGLTASDNSPDVSGRAERAKKILSAFTDAQKIYPVKHMTKFQIYNMLPYELRNITWSCRTPIYKDDIAIECGKCKTCIELNEIKNTPKFC